MKVQVSHQIGKKYPHDLSYDINTTTSFGFCQPILSRQLNAQDSVSLRFGQICRLMPLAQPTFGQMKLKTYTSFVKAEDIWHAYGSFLSGQTYGGAINSYIPLFLPATSCRSLYFLCMALSSVAIFQGNFVVSNGQLRVSGATRFDLNNNSARQEALNKFSVAYGGFKTAEEAQTGLSVMRTVMQERYGMHVDTSFNLDSIFLASGATEFHDVLNYDWFALLQDDNTNLLFAGRFNNLGRNLRKVLIGNGFQLNFDDTRLDILPLFANYKAYFDIFVPQRNITWKDTDAFKLMEYCEQSGLNDFRDFSNLITDGHFSSYWNFILDLATMYYTIPGDYASAHILGLGNDVVPQNLFNYLDNSGTSIQVDSQMFSNGGVSLNQADSQGLNRSALRILNEMQKLSNLHSAVGGNIREYLRAVYNSDYNDDVDSAFIGSQIMDISPEPIFNTAETDQAPLGSFGGAALGTTKGKALKFTAKSPGYLISFFCCVPEARMSQGVDPLLYHSLKEDIYNPRYDALTLLPTRKTAIYGTEEVCMNGITSLQGGFGNIPNFSEYKIKHNILNGDMSLPSTRATYLPFTLDKLLPYRVIRSISDISQNDVSISYGVTGKELVAGTFWRYIGLNRWFGNFDRIFVNDESADIVDSHHYDLLRSYDDKFIIEVYADFKVTGYELPLARSFDTGEMDGDTMVVEKS